MIKILKSLLCNHSFKLHRITSGDENNYSIPYRKVEKCVHCNRLRYTVATDEDFDNYRLS